MRVIFTVLCCLIIAPIVNAQWNSGTSGIYYNQGNVSIGSSSPAAARLDVNGSILASQYLLKSEDGQTTFYIQKPASSADPFRITLGAQTIKGGIMIGREDWMSKVLIPWKVAINTNEIPTGYHFAVAGKMIADDVVVKNKIQMDGYPVPRFNNSISAYTLQSSHFYGHTATDPIYLGEAGNTVGIRGKLGVGINVPGTTLDVRGNIRFTGAANGSSGVGDGFTHFNHSNGNNYIRGNTYIGTSGMVEIYTGTKTILSGGDVGIGTSTPASTLDVNGSVLASQYLLKSDDGQSTFYIQKPATSADPFRITLGSQSIKGGIMIGREDWMSKVVIPWNVGIGTDLTNNPNGYKLAVNGKIGAKEVQVENSSLTWPDYVFEADYPLTPLHDLEIYLKENKHLPNIPTAKEVAEEGIKLGEMNAKLLEKVEELTLYLIEQSKEINILKEKNDVQDQLIKKLLGQNTTENE